MTGSQARARLAVSLAGRAAEEILLDGDFTQGASNDIAKATELAQTMVAEWGMSSLGLAAVGPEHAGSGLVERVHAEADGLLTDALARARALLAAHRPLLEVVVAELLAEETIDLDRIGRLWAAVDGRPGSGGRASPTPKSRVAGCSVPAEIRRVMYVPPAVRPQGTSPPRPNFVPAHPSGPRTRTSEAVRRVWGQDQRRGLSPGPRRGLGGRPAPPRPGPARSWPLGGRRRAGPRRRSPFAGHLGGSECLGAGRSSLPAALAARAASASARAASTSLGVLFRLWPRRLGRLGPALGVPRPGLRLRRGHRHSSLSLTVGGRARLSLSSSYRGCSRSHLDRATSAAAARRAPRLPQPRRTPGRCRASSRAPSAAARPSPGGVEGGVGGHETLHGGVAGGLGVVGAGGSPLGGGQVRLGHLPEAGGGRLLPVALGRRWPPPEPRLR